jgi:ATP-dependent DNA helicase RecQ
VTFQLGDVQSVIDGARTPGPGLLRRLGAAREGLLATPPTAGWADVVVLVRQCLEHWRLTHPGAQLANAAVRVPSARPWPSVEEWKRSSLHADLAAGGNLRISLSAWEPKWLTRADVGVIEAACAAQPLGPEEPTPPADDLVMEVTGFASSASVGQRDAIRGVYLTPPGGTLVALLPTGSGKSLVFQFAALHSAARDGMVVVIVPTVALARDQAHRYCELAGSAAPQVPLAFHSGLDAAERAEVFKAVASGTLPILFVSPEAATGSIRSALLGASSLGRVALFVVDEAHLVAQWGDSFRPEFQALGGLRDAMARESPAGHRFRTVLLTATLTAEGFEVLESVFQRSNGGRKQPLAIVADLWLRREPGYLVSRCEGPDSDATPEKNARLLEALYRLPRPLLIYTSLVDDAKAWHSRLAGPEGGFKRVRCVVGGDMSTPQGEAVLLGWKNGEIDLVVATSAFGLGVDQAEVRSVVHACVPETIDRWYQEVGRAGRDGRACVSLLVASDHDLDVAKGMATEVVIGEQRAFQRWSAMRSDPRCETLGPGRLLVPLDAIPEGLRLSSELNRSWNFRVLTMMARAGMLQLSTDTRELPPPAEGEPKSPTVVVDLMNTGGFTRDSFDAAFGAVRTSRKAADVADAERMEELLRGQRPIHELLETMYKIPAAKVEPATSVGDCPVTRAEGRASRRAGFSPPVKPGEQPCCPISPALKALLPPNGHRILFVSYDRSAIRPFEWAERLKRLYRLLAAAGIVEFDLGAAPLQGTKPWTALAASAPGRYVFGSRPDNLLEPAWQVPMFTLVTLESPDLLASALRRRRPCHIIMIPTDHPDPDRPDRRFFDTRTDLPLGVLLERLGAH